PPAPRVDAPAVVGECGAAAQRSGRALAAERDGDRIGGAEIAVGDGDAGERVDGGGVRGGHGRRRDRDGRRHGGIGVGDGDGGGGGAGAGGAAVGEREGGGGAGAWGADGGGENPGGEFAVWGCGGRRGPGGGDAPA